MKEKSQNKHADYGKMIIKIKNKERIFKVIRYRKIKNDVLGFENNMLKKIRINGALGLNMMSE